MATTARLSQSPRLEYGVFYFGTMNPSYYAIIPASIRYDKELPDGAKLLYGEITALCDKNGYCWASNTYFAGLYGKSSDTISRWISQLARLGYIYSLVDNSKGNSRKIWLAEVVKKGSKNADTLSAKMPIPIRKNADTLSAKMPIPIRKNAEPYKESTTISTTMNNTTTDAREKTAVDAVENFDTWLNSIPADQTIREAFTMSRKVPSSRFDEMYNLFCLEAKTKKETYHTRRKVTDHFLNFAASKHEREKKAPPNSGRTPQRANGLRSWDNDRPELQEKQAF